MIIKKGRVIRPFRLDGFHLVFLKRFQVRCLFTSVELLVSHPWGKQMEHSFLQYTILEIWTFEIFTGKSISPNSLIPNAFRICFCLFIKSLIRLNLMQSSFDGVFKIFHYYVISIIYFRLLLQPKFCKVMFSILVTLDPPQRRTYDQTYYIS